jgi:hypothetical protein
MKTEEPKILKKDIELLRHIHKKCSCYEVPMNECNYRIEKTARIKAGIERLLISAFINKIVESVVNISNKYSENFISKK